MLPTSSSARTDTPARLPRLLFARHGETDWNAEGRLQGQRDTPLNARGRAQALRCGEILRDLFTRTGASARDFDFVASPLARARESMRLLRLGLSLPQNDFATDGRLKELSFGRWEGFTFPELRLDRAAAVAERERDKWGFVPPEGESYEMLVRRVEPWLRETVRPSIVVAHGGVMRALMVLLAIDTPGRAPAANVEQGVVYGLETGTLTRLR